MKTHLRLTCFTGNRVKQMLPLLLLLLNYGTSLGQQDIAINTIANFSYMKELYTEDSSIAGAYVVVNAGEGITAKYKGLQVKIVPDNKGNEMQLQIESKKERSILVELRNHEDDELLFKEVKLQAGTNIIYFETDNTADAFYKINLSNPHSNKMASYVVMKN